VNQGTAPATGLTLTTVEAGPLAVAPTGTCGVRLTRSGAPVPREGRTVQDYVVLDDGVGGSARCGPAPLAPVGSDVLTAPAGGPDAALVTDLPPGEVVRLSWSLGWPDVLDAIGGSPVLVQGGAVVGSAVSGTDGFSRRNPRTAVGHRADGTVLLVTVSGRGKDGSVGMTLRELAELFVRLGASDALNLDGGGSTTMVIGGELQNVPSDGLERAVSSALVLSGGALPVGAQGTEPDDPLRALPNGPADSEPEPLTGPEQRAVQEAQLSDPGSSGGLLGP
jgi:hypothetical protein